MLNLTKSPGVQDCGDWNDTAIASSCTEVEGAISVQELSDLADL